MRRFGEVAALSGLGRCVGKDTSCGPGRHARGCGSDCGPWARYSESVNYIPAVPGRGGRVFAAKNADVRQQNPLRGLGDAIAVVTSAVSPFDW